MSRTVIVADGSFPVHPVPLGILHKAEMIVCCDGSAESLVGYGLIPDAIVGDMDSLSKDLKNRFSDRIYIDCNQETNDLTKAVLWCHESGYDDLVIIGAGGKREDHTIGNISLLAEYARIVKVKMVTDSGVFLPFLTSCKIESSKGQQVSIFSICPANEITSSGLLYPLTSRTLTNWWQGTLNEAAGEVFELRFTGGPVLVFLKFIEAESEQS
ncbi:MAG: thiamine diphosphokinase [Bacteroidales bacterium]